MTVEKFVAGIPVDPAMWTRISSNGALDAIMGMTVENLANLAAGQRPVRKTPRRGWEANTAKEGWTTTGGSALVDGVRRRLEAALCDTFRSPSRMSTRSAGEWGRIVAALAEVPTRGHDLEVLMAGRELPCLLRGA